MLLSLSNRSIALTPGVKAGGDLGDRLLEARDIGAAACAPQDAGDALTSRQAELPRHVGACGVGAAGGEVSEGVPCVGIPRAPEIVWLQTPPGSHGGEHLVDVQATKAAVFRNLGIGSGRG